MAVKRSLRLECSSCKEINYLTFKNSKKNPEKLALKKYCSRCRQHHIHNETKCK
ncbi:MAG: 50S ribosomal protein L33 [Malacoplasma sp.]|nr:50S ribosomal protein L33 [Malacoplasma sp.]